MTDRERRIRRPRPGASVGLTLLMGLCLGVSYADAQANPPAQGGAQGTARNLTARYRFRQVFKGEAPAINQYQVAYRENFTLTGERPQGAPHQETYHRMARYTDRPAEVGPIDDRIVASVVRRYDQAAVTRDPFPRPGVRPLLSDLVLWIKPQPGGPTEMLVLNPPHLFREEEFRFVGDTPFYPNFAMVVPADEAVGLDSTWKVSGLAVEALVGMPVQGDSVTATLKDVRPSAAGGSEQVAVISVTGRVMTAKGDTALNAELEFTFTSQAPTDANAPADTPVNAMGGISKVRMAQTARDGPTTLDRDLLLQCRWPGNGPPVELPAAPPKPTRENSWLTWIDAEERFYFSYPQIYGLEWLPKKNPNVVELKQEASVGSDLITFTFKPNEQVRPDDVFQRALNIAKENQFTVRSSPAPDKLDTKDWTTGAEVQHMEAKLTHPSGRQYVREFYVLHFPKNDSLIVMATTPTNEVQAFRERVEGILKTFHLGIPQGVDEGK